MTKSISEKMGIEQNARSIFINAPEDAVKAIELPDINLQKKLTGDFDYIHFFVISQKDFHNEFPILKSHLKKTGSLWVSWQKSGKNNTDLNMKSVLKSDKEMGFLKIKVSAATLLGQP